MPIRIYKRGEVWHFRGTVAGRRLRGSTGTTDKATAQRIAAEREARAWKGHLDGPEAVLTFAQAAMRYRAAGKATRYLDRIEDYWRDTLVKDINAGAVQHSARALYPGVSPATLNRQVIVPTAAIINHAAEAELCQRIRVKRFPVTTKRKTPATWEWVQAFMAHASPHLGGLACFLFLTGARVSEALAVRWEDVDLAARRVLIRQTKVGDERLAHLPPPLLVAMANIGGRREPEDKVFRYSSRHTAKPQWNKAIRRAGIKPLTFHACRHGFATGLLHQGIDPITVAKRGGWKSPAHLFSTYGHAMEDETVADRLVTEIGTPVTQDDGVSKLKRVKSNG